MGYITKICPGLANHLAVLSDVVVGYAVNGFAVADAFGALRNFRWVPQVG